LTSADNVVRIMALTPPETRPKSRRLYSKKEAAKREAEAHQRMAESYLQWKAASEVVQNGPMRTTRWEDHDHRHPRIEREVGVPYLPDLSRFRWVGFPVSQVCRRGVAVLHPAQHSVRELPLAPGSRELDPFYNGGSGIPIMQFETVEHQRTVAGAFPGKLV
jgi:hypothetical protein